MLALFLALIIAFLGTPLIRLVSLRFGVVDIPNSRSSHAAPTPRGGGVAIIAAIVVVFFIVAPSSDPPLIGLIAGVGAIAILGLIDDLTPLSAAVRITVQSIVAAVVATVGIALAELASPMTPPMALSSGIAVAITIFWTVGATNAYNFMDGINGIASVQAIVAGTGLAVLLARNGDPAAAILALAAAGAAVGFLPWNFPSARIFMGDVGSASLGFLFALLAVRLSRIGGSLLEGALPLLPFLFDTGTTLVRRIVRGERWWEAHRSHLYQRMVQRGFSHGQVTAVWGSLAVASTAAALSLRFVSVPVAWSSVAAVLALHLGLMVWLARDESRSATS